MCTIFPVLLLQRSSPCTPRRMRTSRLLMLPTWFVFEETFSGRWATCLYVPCLCCGLSWLHRIWRRTPQTLSLHALACISPACSVLCCPVVRPTCSLYRNAWMCILTIPRPSRKASWCRSRPISWFVVRNALCVRSLASQERGCWVEGEGRGEEPNTCSSFLT